MAFQHMIDYINNYLDYLIELYNDGEKEANSDYDGATGLLFITKMMEENMYYTRYQYYFGLYNETGITDERIYDRLIKNKTNNLNLMYIVANHVTGTHGATLFEVDINRRLIIEEIIL